MPETAYLNVDDEFMNALLEHEYTPSKSLKFFLLIFS